MKTVLRGKGKINEVKENLTNQILELLKDPSDQATQWRDQETTKYIVEYIIKFLMGGLEKDELSYTLASQYLDDNLKLTELIGYLDEHADEWRDWAKNPKMWFAYYRKDYDESNGTYQISMADSDEMPGVSYRTPEDEKSLLSDLKSTQSDVIQLLETIANALNGQNSSMSYSSEDIKSILNNVNQNFSSLKSTIENYIYEMQRLARERREYKAKDPNSSAAA